MHEKEELEEFLDQKGGLSLNRLSRTCTRQLV